MQLIGVKPFLLTVWEWVKWSIVGIARSVYSFATSPQVWLAGIACMCIGYYGGFLMLAGKISSVNASNNALHAEVILLTDENLKLAKAAEAARNATPALPSPLAIVPEPVQTEFHHSPPPRKRPTKPAQAVVEKPWWSVLIPWF